MANETVRAVFTKGSHQFGKGGLFTTYAKQALSQNIEHTIRKTGLSKEIATAQIRESYKDSTELALSYFAAMVGGAGGLILDSKVDVLVHSQLIDNPRYSAYQRKSRIKSTRSGPRPSFAPRIVRTIGMLANAKGPVGTPATIDVDFTVPQKWKYLTERYAKRKPVSEIFFKKRNRNTSGSAAGAFIKKVPSMISRAKNIRTYQGGLNNVAAHGVGGWKGSYKISYPNLGELDFIRRSFLHGMTNTSGGDITPGGDIHGILWAEKWRPLMRPYASFVGKEYFKAIKQMQKRKLDNSPPK
jgi:hypothetical protein